MTDTCGTHIIVHRREVSAVWSFHLLIYSVLGQQDFPLFGSSKPFFLYKCLKNSSCLFLIVSINDLLLLPWVPEPKNNKKKK